MLSSSPQNSVADYYFGFLKNLNKDCKLDLIAKLSLSIKDEQPVAEKTLDSLFGAYQSDETAEEIIEAIRSSRVSNRNIEAL